MIQIEAAHIDCPKRNGFNSPEARETTRIPTTTGTIYGYTCTRCQSEFWIKVKQEDESIRKAPSNE